MKRLHWALIATIAFLVSCQEPINQEVIAEDGTPKLLGKIDKDGLNANSYAEWFDEAYQDYSVNTELVNDFKEELGSYDIQVFMGTWCEDSQREVPALYKILEAANFPMEQLEVIAIDDALENYKQSPGGEHIGKNIHHVPAIIFMKEGAEVNRIVEYPVQTIEEDIRQILENAYTPYYHTADLIDQELNKMGLEKFAANLETMAAAYEGRPDNVSELNTYAKMLFYSGKRDEAVAVGKLNVMLFPEEAEAYVGLGKRLSEMGRTMEAITQYEKAVELAPDDSEFKALLEEARQGN